MSVVAIAWRAHPYFPLVLIYNRSELHARPTAPAGWQGDVLAGRALQGGGSWLAVSRNDGGFALATGHHDGVFSCGAEHGTRASTVFIMGRDGCLHFKERSFNAAGEPTGTVLETWQQDPAVFGAPG